MITEQIEYLVAELEATQSAYPSRERALAITNLQQGQHWLEALERKDMASGAEPGPPPFAGKS
jgi:hypothetical protein